MMVTKLMLVCLSLSWVFIMLLYCLYYLFIEKQGGKAVVQIQLRFFWLHSAAPASEILHSRRENILKKVDFEPWNEKSKLSPETSRQLKVILSGAVIAQCFLGEAALRLNYQIFPWVEESWDNEFSEKFQRTEKTC